MAEVAALGCISKELRPRKDAPPHEMDFEIGDFFIRHQHVDAEVDEAVV
jgi:hypothetical protein